MSIYFIDHKINNEIINNANSINNLIHRWPLISNANDVISGLNMTNNNGVTFSSNGASFNGTNQWLNCTKTRPEQITMSIWVTPVNFSARRGSFSASDIGGGNTYWGVNADIDLTTAIVGYAHSTTFLTIANEYTTTNYPTTSKTLICITYDRTTLKYYRNTTLKGSIAITPAVAGSTYLAIGRQGAFSGCYWYGTLADARIYNRALTITEITQLYNEGPNFNLINNIISIPKIQNRIISYRR